MVVDGLKKKVPVACWLERLYGEDVYCQEGAVEETFGCRVVIGRLFLLVVVLGLTVGVLGVVRLELVAAEDTTDVVVLGTSCPLLETADVAVGCVIGIDSLFTTVTVSTAV